MAGVLNDEALDIIFRVARTQNGWLDTPVSHAQLHKLYDLMRMGPTSANTCPARIIFLTTPEAKERLVPHLDEGNIVRVRAAPVAAIIGQDMEFYEKLPQLFPHAPDIISVFKGKDEFVATTAFRNSSLQGAYFMIAARAIGLDVGAMSGFDNAGVDEEFFAGTAIKSNFLCNVGHGDPDALFGRLPRLNFDEACEIL